MLGSIVVHWIVILRIRLLRCSRTSRNVFASTITWMLTSRMTTCISLLLPHFYFLNNGLSFTTTKLIFSDLSTRNSIQCPRTNCCNRFHSIIILLSFTLIYPLSAIPRLSSFLLQCLFYNIIWLYLPLLLLQLFCLNI